MKTTLLLFICALLVACGSAPKKPSPAPGGKGGGYYLDDGPGDNAPANLDSIPDAVPRAEPLMDRANKPYMALGKRYVPMTSHTPYKAEGIATWYGKRYHGSKTASGEVYDMYAMTAAHPTLPLPSYARVTHASNGRSVVVRINDRGPFVAGRVIDLSYVAAHRIGLLGPGSAKVIVEAIDTSGGSASATASATAAPMVNSFSAGVYLQVGAFNEESNADRLRQQLNQLLDNPGVQKVNISSWYNRNLYRVRLGPYSDREQAEQVQAKIRQSLGIDAILLYQQ
ncbi:septal ring lytic transglycosylase RlpA family protein [Pseudomethylobacillus aquaticus]|uniref:Endolytic peptidoglycan transglycosylase RlpA n=1 Tax=Pseudomethylobacillus aquaticus TaxID=2676064 RepID=A0A3N0UV10_9PROT|nr:septal ring lytic transglycosylase RlpA family protein [Pseudomethylobacillus aquaticus]ROH84064.1 septal ring lytic transglycosylase RlpA family protein [Pseudomethylobacillus aquaticus]